MQDIVPVSVPINYKLLIYFIVVENTRVELVTSCMPCKRSSQLS